MTQKFVNATLLAFSTCIILASCTDSDDRVPTEGNSNAKVFATSSDGAASGSSNSRISATGFTSTQFTVATSELKLKYAAKAEIESGISLGNISLKTNINSSLQTASAETKSLTIIASGDTKTELIAEGETPEGTYAEAEFLLKKNTVISSSDPRFNKSLWINGNINGKQAVIWSETEKTIRAMSQTTSGVKVEGQSEMILDFDRSKLYAGVNFALAIDGNANGVIEIGPNGLDGNSLLYSRIMSNLDGAVMLRKRN
jgi:hypothetical protein